MPDGTRAIEFKICRKNSYTPKGVVVVNVKIAE